MRKFVCIVAALLCLLTCIPECNLLSANCDLHTFIVELRGGSRLASVHYSELSELISAVKWRFFDSIRHPQSVRFIE
ncbi:hypothetical protein BJX62DRAFT_99512 [Aspergillus germanicus]